MAAQGGVTIRAPSLRRPGVLPRPLWLALTFAFAAGAWSLAGVFWSAGRAGLAVSVAAAGLSLGPCLAGYLAAPRRQKQLLRRVVLATGGVSILAPALVDGIPLDFEAAIMLLAWGVMGAAVGHTLVTVVVGPLLFGRLLCGWGCWRAMVLELLPIGRSPGRRRGAWRVLPLFGLTTSVAVSTFAAIALRARPLATFASTPSEGLAAILATIALYYALSIVLAFRLRDQRAFCKYLCPSGAILRFTSRPALARIGAWQEACDACGACSRVCPMDIPVAEFAAAGRRVGSGECILCQRCVHECPSGALRLTLGRDLARRTPLLPLRDAGSPNRDLRAARVETLAHV